MQTFMDIAHEMEHVSAMKHREEATGVSFNLNHYKANKEVGHACAHYELFMEIKKMFDDNLLLAHPFANEGVCGLTYIMYV